MFCILYFSLMKRNPCLKFIANVTFYWTDNVIPMRGPKYGTLATHFLLETLFINAFQNFKHYLLSLYNMSS